MEKYENCAKILNYIINFDTYEGIAEIEVGNKRIFCFVLNASKKNEKLKIAMVKLSLTSYRVEKRPIKIKGD
jgi:vacuolar-type H+-ATPase subunit I/STV1